MNWVSNQTKTLVEKTPKPKPIPNQTKQPTKQSIHQNKKEGERTTNTKLPSSNLKILIMKSKKDNKN